MKFVKSMVREMAAHDDRKRYLSMPNDVPTSPSVLNPARR